MKSLKKKICVSVCLDELFEEVEEKSRDTEVVGYGTAYVLKTESLLKKQTRLKRFGKALHATSGDRESFRYQLERLQEEEWLSPVIKKVDAAVEPLTEECESPNDYDVDEYSESELEQETVQVDVEEWTKKKDVRVDIAISTEKNPSGMEAKISDVSTQTGGNITRENRCVQSMFEEDCHEPMCSAEVAPDQKLCLVARCANSMNLPEDNHKSTQFDFGTCANSITEPLPVVEHKTIKELYHRGYSCVNLLKRVQFVVRQEFVDRYRMFSKIPHPRLSSDSIVAYEKDLLQEWRNEKLSSRGLHSGRAEEHANLRIMTKDVFQKFKASNPLFYSRERILCYALGTPWEITNIGELILSGKALSRGNLPASRKKSKSTVAEKTSEPVETKMAGIMVRQMDVIMDGRGDDRVLVEIAEVKWIPFREDEKIEVKVYRQKYELRQIANGSNTIEVKEGEEVVVQWELDIEIVDDCGNLEKSDEGTVIEYFEKTDKMYIYSSQSSEDNFLKEGVIRGMCTATQLLRILEEKLSCA